MRFLILIITVVALWCADLMAGSVTIGLREVIEALCGNSSDPVTAGIVIDIRLIKSLVALLGGAALSASGLLMQTLFRNPLAGPYVLGISAGASLAVAIVMLGMPVALMGAVGESFGIAGAAWCGAAAVLVIIGLLSRRVKNLMVILIIGMMLSSGISAIVQILQYLSPESALKAYVVWTMGSLSDVTRSGLTVMVPAILIGLLLAVVVVKPLNLLLFGEEYAVTMGLNLKRARTLIFLSTSLLAGSMTAFCGPIGFIGLAMPHVARMIISSSDHRKLLPATILTGSASLLLCDIISKSFALPINAITALLGIPVIVWVVLRNRG